MALFYDPPSGSYTQVIPPGVKAFREFVKERFGFRTEVIRDLSRCRHSASEHCDCRAADSFVTAPKGRPLFDFCVTNAERFGLQSVIHDRRVWGFGKWYERAYTGPSPHTDHVHTGFNRWGAANLTRAMLEAAWTGQEEPFMALTDAEQKELLDMMRAVHKDAEEVRQLAHGIKNASEKDALGKFVRGIAQKLGVAIT